MASLEFSRREVENLARKLDSVQAQLSESERTLLLAIFAAAGDHVDVVVQLAGTELRTSDFRDQIVKSFIPGDDDVYAIPCRIGYIARPTPKPVPTTPPPTPDPAAPTPAEERPSDPAPSDGPPAQP